ncbi:MAG: hypothetical protein Q9157_003427 [Trypethelium eluteriae]
MKSFLFLFTSMAVVVANGILDAPIPSTPSNPRPSSNANHHRPIRRGWPYHYNGTNGGERNHTHHYNGTKGCKWNRTHHYNGTKGGDWNRTYYCIGTKNGESNRTNNSSTSTSSLPTFSIIPIPIFEPASDSSSSSSNYYQPAINWGNSSQNPSAWIPQPTHAFTFTPSGGQRDMSQSHPFVHLNVEYDGNRTGVDLEGTDGIKNIDCQPGQWRIQTKDTDHFNVAKSWPKDIILVTSTFCRSGASRRLIQADRLSYKEPDTIMAYGQQSLLGLAPPVLKMRTNFGHHKPNSAKRGLDGQQHRPIREWKRTSDNEKRNGQGITSVIGNIPFQITQTRDPISTGPVLVTTVTVEDKDKRNVGDRIRSRISSRNSHFKSRFGGLFSTANSDVQGAVGTVTSDVKGAMSTGGSEVLGALDYTVPSTTVSRFVQIPKSTPTGVSPWGNPGNKEFGFLGMDFWDLGIKMSGGVEFEGNFEIDAKKIGQSGFLSGELGINGSNWEFDFPLGLNFQNASFEHTWNTWQLIEPIDICPDVGCFAIENVFELGSQLQVTLNITLEVNATGKLTTGTNITYSQPAAKWNFGDESKNSATGWDGDHQKWFNYTDGNVTLSGGLGFDLTQFNGLSFPQVPNANTNVSFSNGVSIVGHVSMDTKGNSKFKRSNMSKREHPKDILARVLMKKDTCTDNGGIEVSLDLEGQVIVQAGVWKFGTAKPLYATQIPLYSTCIS